MVGLSASGLHIIGGGILGVLFAMRAAEQGLPVTVYRISDAKHPEADSLRNHGWLQSGLLYMDWLSKSAMLKMKYSGYRLLDTFAITPSTSNGVFCLRNDEDARQLEKVAAWLQFGSRVSRLSETEARERMGRFFEPAFLYYWVPDAPFPEGRIIESARDRSARLGARFVNLTEPVKLRRSNDHGKVLIEFDGESIQPEVLVLTAGSRIPVLLSQVEASRPLVVSQSPLMVLPGCGDIDVPLYVDRRTGLTVVRHGPSNGRPDGCLVVGNSYRTPVPQDRLEMPRVLDDRALSSIRDLLPPSVLERAASTPGVRYTAGHKTEFYRPDHGCTVEPWIEEFNEFPGLFAAVPGKATFALSTADDLLVRVRAYMEAVDLPYAKSRIVQLTNVDAWTDDVKLHHETHYDKTLNDIRSKNQL